MNRQQSVSIFQAAKHLKHTQDEASEIMNRIQLLQQQEKRNLKMIELNQKSIQVLDQKRRRIKEQTQQRKQRQNINHEKSKKLIDRNRTLKELRAQKMMDIRENIYQTKKMQCEITRNNSQHIQRKITQLKQSYFNQNRQKRDFAYFERDTRKQNIKNKQIQRTQNIRKGTCSDIQKMIQIKEKKENQIKKLQLIQSQLLEKCKISSEMNLTLKQQLKSRKNTQTPRPFSKKLPFINNNKGKLKISADDFFPTQVSSETQ